VDGKLAFIGLDDFTNSLTKEYSFFNKVLATESHSNTAFGVLTQGFAQPAVSVDMQKNTKAIIAFGGCDNTTMTRQVYGRLTAVLVASMPQPTAFGKFFQDIVDGDLHNFLYIAKDDRPSTEGHTRSFFKNFEQNCDPKESANRAAVPEYQEVQGRFAPKSSSQGTSSSRGA
jgi:hypothetical protein